MHAGVGHRFFLKLMNKKGAKSLGKMSKLLPNFGSKISFSVDSLRDDFDKYAELGNDYYTLAGNLAFVLPLISTNRKSNTNSNTALQPTSLTIVLLAATVSMCFL